MEVRLSCFFFVACSSICYNVIWVQNVIIGVEIGWTWIRFIYEWKFGCQPNQIRLLTRLWSMFHHYRVRMYNETPKRMRCKLWKFITFYLLSSFCTNIISTNTHTHTHVFTLFINIFCRNKTASMCKREKTEQKASNRHIESRCGDLIGRLWLLYTFYYTIHINPLNLFVFVTN